jgi:hypothetical protein
MSALVPHRLVRPTGVVPLDTLANGCLGFSEATQAMLPDTLRLQTTEEALDDAILLGRVWRDELLRQAVVAVGRTEPAVIARSAFFERPQRANSQPISSPLQQSITPTRSARPFQPKSTFVMSITQGDRPRLYGLRRSAHVAVALRNADAPANPYPSGCGNCACG